MLVYVILPDLSRGRMVQVDWCRSWRPRAVAENRIQIALEAF